jgi:hypothetical protein
MARATAAAGRDPFAGTTLLLASILRRADSPAVLLPPAGVQPASRRGATSVGVIMACSHQRKAFVVKRLVGASSVVCPRIAVMGLVPAACNRVVQRRAGLPMMSVEVIVVPQCRVGLTPTRAWRAPAGVVRGVLRRTDLDVALADVTRLGGTVFGSGGGRIPGSLPP